MGQSWVEVVLLVGVVVAVLVVELLNTAVEAAIDRVGPEWHAQSKLAKDTGSAAVLVTLVNEKVSARHSVNFLCCAPLKASTSQLLGR